MIFQQFNLVPRLDVLTNVLLGRLNHRSTMTNLFGMFSRAECAEAVAALERLDIARTDTSQNIRLLIGDRSASHRKFCIEPPEALTFRNAIGDQVGSLPNQRHSAYRLLELLLGSKLLARIVSSQSAFAAIPLQSFAYPQSFVSKKTAGESSRPTTTKD